MKIKCLILFLFLFPIRTFPQCLKADIVFLLDWSGSEKEHGGYISGAAIDFINTLNLGPTSVKVGLVPFGSSPLRNWCTFITDDKSVLIPVLLDLSSTVPNSLTTDFLSPLELSNELFKRSELEREEEVIKIIIIISDGLETSDLYDTQIYSDILKSKGCAIWCVGASSSGISDEGRDHLIRISNGIEFYCEGTYFVLREELMRLNLCP